MFVKIITRTKYNEKNESKKLEESVYECNVFDMIFENEHRIKILMEDPCPNVVLDNNGEYTHDIYIMTSEGKTVDSYCW